MNITGIIAEYNPFHKGHEYQIRQIRERFGSHYIIAVMSGDFVQRGAPALADKYTRAHMALLGGADLVLELPAVYATASAEAFAQGGIRTLAATGIVTSVSFGMEQADPQVLLTLSNILSQEPPWYQDRLLEGLKMGLSFPAARSRALPEYAGFMASPNNILALEYAKAVKKYAPQLALLPIQRRGSGYHQEELDASLASAKAIRSFLKAGSPFPDGSPIAAALPNTSLRVLEDYQRKAPFLYEEDLSLPLGCALIGQTQETLESISGITPALAGRILRLREDYASFPGFCRQLKTKELTYTHISRALLHILLGITDGLMSQDGQVPYLRLLGFRRSAASLLGQMKELGHAPLISSLAKACSDSVPLAPKAQALLQRDLHAHDLYRTLITCRTGRPWPSQFRRKLLVVD